jgi:glycerol-1-phosphate dehydrogenase [NAD(P)+]
MRPVHWLKRCDEAAGLQIQQGEGALIKASKSWPTYNVITSPSPWSIVSKIVRRPPAQVFFVKNLQRKGLLEISPKIEKGSTVVGIGSGTAMDAAKAIAKFNGAALIQVPSTASNNAYFTTTAWTFEATERIPERGCPVARDVIIDRELITSAPLRLNRAGLAEILCSYTALYDWKLGHQANRDVDWNDDLVGFTQSELRSLQTMAPAVGAGDPDAIMALIAAGARFAPYFATYPKARFNGGSEHVFAWALEEQANIPLIHGEIVALGIVVMSVVQGQEANWPLDIIRAAKINFRPDDWGLSWKVIEDTVDSLPAYSRRVPWYSILNELEVQGEHGRTRCREALEVARHLIGAKRS